MYILVTTGIHIQRAPWIVWVCTCGYCMRSKRLLLDWVKHAASIIHYPAHFFARRLASLAASALADAPFCGEVSCAGAAGPADAVAFAACALALLKSADINAPPAFAAAGEAAAALAAELAQAREDATAGPKNDLAAAGAVPTSS